MHPESDAAAYPEHLREAAQALPDAPGVYMFQGAASQALPLYIGKSIRIRTRVLSHLRCRDEATMLRQTRRIEHRLTGGEVGALLLEARLIKERQPLYNRRLRLHRHMLSWHWHTPPRTRHATLRLTHAGELDFSAAQGLFGLFRSRRAARLALDDLADAHQLCLQAVGLERGGASGPCFRHAIGRCAGACCGCITRVAHEQAWREALAPMALRAWPFDGAVGLVECHDQVQQIHVLNRWCYLGSAADKAGAQALVEQHPSYDIDSYKILVAALNQADTVTIPL